MSGRFGLKDTKTHISRVVPLMPKVALLLEKYKESLPSQPEQRIFQTVADRRPLETRQVDDAFFYAALSRIGIAQSVSRKRLET